MSGHAAYNKRRMEIIEYKRYGKADWLIMGSSNTKEAGLGEDQFIARDGSMHGYLWSENCYYVGDFAASTVSANTGSSYTDIKTNRCGILLEQIKFISNT